MKEKLTRNIGLKVLSIILAAILWLLITNVDDPITTKPFDNVPVKILNEDAIVSQDKVYEILEGTTIDFTVAARRSIADSLTISDFEVTADFAKLSDVNAVTINITCPRYGDDVNVTDGLYQVMKINPEKLVERNFKVTVVTKGDPTEGFYVGEKSANTIVTVSGAQSKIEKIKEIIAEVNVSDASESFRSTEKLKALDEEGEEISGLTFSVNYATINIDIYKTKKVDLIVSIVGKPSMGYVVSNVDYEPKSIEVAGDDEALGNINALHIEEDVTGAMADVEKEINIQEQLGEGLILVGEDQTVAVNITIEKAVTKEITIWPPDLSVTNLNPTLNLSYLSTAPILIKISGPAAELTNLSVDSIKPYINLQDYSMGTYNAKIGVELGPHCSLLEEPTVNIYLIAK